MLEKKHKRTTIFVAILILALGFFIGGRIFLQDRAGTASISGQISYLLGNQMTQIKDASEIDSDNDGLKDWEEKIYKTDAKNPDSDNDGYMDGEEIASGYDPLKKAPGDEIFKSAAARPLPQNLTRALSLKLSQSIASGDIKSYDDTGKLIDATGVEKQAGLEQAIKDSIGQQLNNFILPQIDDSEIKISETQGKEATLKYLSAIGDALKKISTSEKTEEEIFQEAISKGNFGPLEEGRQSYYAGYQSLKEVSVPRDLAEFHKGLIGVFFTTANIYAAVKEIKTDPLKTTIALVQYNDVSKTTGNLMSQLLEKVKRYQ